jgi:hypothetical protein
MNCSKSSNAEPVSPSDAIALCGASSCKAWNPDAIATAPATFMRLGSKRRAAAGCPCSSAGAADADVDSGHAGSLDVWSRTTAAWPQGTGRPHLRRCGLLLLRAPWALDESRILLFCCLLRAGPGPGWIAAPCAMQRQLITAAAGLAARAVCGSWRTLKTWVVVRSGRWRACDVILASSGLSFACLVQSRPLVVRGAHGANRGARPTAIVIAAAIRYQSQSAPHRACRPLAARTSEKLHMPRVD